MDIDKDYYAILGVLPSAEHIVIKAAYRALSKRYHPDVYKGSNIAEKMADINEAYEILSDPAKKSEYDQARDSKNQATGEYFNDDFGTHNTVDPLEADWEVAIKYHPDLEDAAADLTKYSKKLAYVLKSYILETKDFDRIHAKKRAILEEFLELHFGKNERIIQFAKELFNDGRTDMLLELNKAIRVLGVANTDERIIPKIKAEYGYFTHSERFDLWLKQLGADAWIGVSSAPQLYELWGRSPIKAEAALGEIMKKARIDANRAEEKSAFNRDVWDQMT